MKLFSRIFLTSVLLLSSAQLFSAAADGWLKEVESVELPEVKEAPVGEEEAFLGQQEEPVAASSSLGGAEESDDEWSDEDDEGDDEEEMKLEEWLPYMVNWFNMHEVFHPPLNQEMQKARKLSDEIITDLQSDNVQQAVQKMEKLADLFDILGNDNEWFAQLADYFREEAKKLASKESGASEEAAPAATRAGVAVTADDKASARSLFNRINQSKAFRGNVRSNKDGLLDRLNALAAKGLKDAVSAQALLKKMN